MFVSGYGLMRSLFPLVETSAIAGTHLKVAWWLKLCCCRPIKAYAGV